MMAEFEIYTSGLCCMSVCTTLADTTEIEEFANLANPTGIESKWKISSDKTFKGGEPMPCPCNRHPDTHKHYLLNC